MKQLSQMEAISLISFTTHGLHFAHRERNYSQESQFLYMFESIRFHQTKSNAKSTRAFLTSKIE